MSAPWEGILNKIDDYRWEIPIGYKTGMRVPGLIYASEALLSHIWEENAFEQVANVAFLPGIVGHSLAMPDIHWGYGFPIGGVAATRLDDGVVSPGGVGFDINCGVRVMRTNLTEAEVRPKIDRITTEIYHNVPSGLGTKGKLRVNDRELTEIMVKGSKWAVARGYGEPDDVKTTEESGCIEGADPEKVSSRARERGLPQLGTMGSGNHFLEIQRVDEIYDRETANVMGIQDIGQVLVMVHSGSRGFGHQICSDYLSTMGQAISKYGINLPDRQLACAPVKSPEGQAYLSAMACAANYAWTNRQCMAHWVRESLMKALGKSPRDIGLAQIWDVAHNIAKIEEHTVDVKKVKLCVHRKGATRSLPPDDKRLPQRFRKTGQPVLVPGDMGRMSFILAGAKGSSETFFSACHGAGRLLSRHEAKKRSKGRQILEELLRKDIHVMAASRATLAEEIPEAYKDVSDVVDTITGAGIATAVARLIPFALVKG